MLTTFATLACPRVPAVVLQTEVEAPRPAPAVVVEAPSAATTATCVARTPPGALLLIPDMAEWAVHIGPRAMLQSPAYKLFAPQIERGSQWQQMLDMLRPCGVAVEQVDHLVMGFNAAEDFVAVLVAPGIARADVATCLIMQVQLASSEQPIADVRPLPGDPSVAMVEFTDGRAYLFGDDMFVLATSAWQDTVADLSSCRGAPAAYGPLAAPLRGLDLDAPLWVAGAPPSSTLKPVGDTIGIDLTGFSSFGASMRLDDSAALRARVQMRDAASASGTTQTLLSLLQIIRQALPPELAGLANRIVINSNDTEVQIEVTLRADELRFIASQM